jgi:hypothetical protein
VYKNNIAALKAAAQPDLNKPVCTLNLDKLANVPPMVQGRKGKNKKKFF